MGGGVPLRICHCKPTVNLSQRMQARKRVDLQAVRNFMALAKQLLKTDKLTTFRVFAAQGVVRKGI